MIKIDVRLIPPLLKSELRTMSTTCLQLSITICFLQYASCVFITIENAGFESDVITHDNSYIYSGDTDLAFPWLRHDPLSLMAKESIGVMNPTGGTSFNDTVFGDGVPEGTQSCYIEPEWRHTNAGEHGLTQTLTGHTVSAGVTYTLSAWIGNLQRNIWSANSQDGVSSYDVSGFPGYRIQLVANGNILAQDNNQKSIDEGHWAQSIVSVTISSGDSHIGQTLGIRLINKNVYTGTGLSEVCFDGVQLEATTMSPTLSPTNHPTDNPSDAPTYYPTLYPSVHPTKRPSHAPNTAMPTALPSQTPSLYPSLHPTMHPTRAIHITSESMDQMGGTMNHEKDKPNAQGVGWDMIVILIVLISLIVLVCLSIIVISVFLMKRRKQKKEPNLEPVVSLSHSTVRQSAVHNREDSVQYQGDEVMKDTQSKCTVHEDDPSTSDTIIHDVEGGKRETIKGVADDEFIIEGDSFVVTTGNLNQVTTR
eukprot:295482_1